jgi:hypothetical protein
VFKRAGPPLTEQTSAPLPTAVGGRSLSVAVTATTLSVSATAVSLRQLLAAVAAAGDIDVTVHQIPESAVTLTVPPLPTGEALKRLVGDLPHTLSRGVDGRWRLLLGEPAVAANAAALRSERPVQEAPAGANFVVTESYARDAAGSRGVAFSVAEHTSNAFQIANGRRRLETVAHTEHSLQVVEESLFVGSPRTPSSVPAPSPASSVSPFSNR